MSRSNRYRTHLIQSKPNFDNAFTFTVQTDDLGTSNDNQFTLPFYAFINYDPMQIDWGDGSFQTGVTSSVTHTFPVAGLYTIKINNCNGWSFKNPSNVSSLNDSRKIRQVSQVGDFRITIDEGFLNCTNLTWTATDVPLIQTNSLGSYFSFCSNFNGDLSNWDVSGVVNLERLFRGCSVFNQDISNWNVANVTNMLFLFLSASAFNQNLSNWTINQNLSTFSAGFHSSGMSCENYTDTMVSWINQAKTNGNPTELNASNQLSMTFATSRSGGVNYADAGVARTNALETVANGGLGWSITNDAVQSNC